MKPTHLAGAHPGSAADCEITCMRCGHPCRAHTLGVACTMCSDCKSYLRPRFKEDMSALTVTGIVVATTARFAEAWLAIDAWKAQTYAHKELVVVSREDLPTLGWPCLHPPTGLLTRGDMLNYAIARAKGGFVAIWGEGFHPPDQLARQMSVFSTNFDVDACLFHGTILARRWRLPTYPASDDLDSVTRSLSVTQIS